MENITGAKLRDKIINKLEYIGGDTHDLVEALKKCVIISKDRLLDLGNTTIEKTEGKEKFEFTSKFVARAEFETYFNEYGEFVEPKQKEVEGKLQDELEILLNGLYLEKPANK